MLPLDAEQQLEAWAVETNGTQSINPQHLFQIFDPPGFFFPTTKK